MTTTIATHQDTCQYPSCGRPAEHCITSPVTIPETKHYDMCYRHRTAGVATIRDWTGVEPYSTTLASHPAKAAEIRQRTAQWERDS